MMEGILPELLPPLPPPLPLLVLFPFSGRLPMEAADEPPAAVPEPEENSCNGKKEGIRKLQRAKSYAI